MTTRIALQFHPDWPYNGQTVIEGMAATGEYRSQFATGISNGGMTAYPGGDRYRWESRLFGGRYDALPNRQRPVYGAVDLGNAYGPAPRFGSAFVRLRPEVGERATFCYPDSVFDPTHVVDDERAGELVARMRQEALDPLDRYVEAHVHEGVLFERDVEAVVLDPCFRETDIAASARELGCDVEFHDGFVLQAADADAQYRGEAAVTLARQLGETLTPRDIGAAARTGKHDRQQLKYVWHLMARFGQRKAQ